MLSPNPRSKVPAGEDTRQGHPSTIRRAVLALVATFYISPVIPMVVMIRDRMTSHGVDKVLYDLRDGVAVR